MSKTIFALATPPGRGGISIIRISGDLAKETLEKIFDGEIVSHKLSLGSLRNEGLLLDQCMAVFMQKPKSYTKEDVVELHLHGGPAVVKQVMLMLSSMGLEPAGPGEFTKRAFLNGRIDLTQAEAVMDMIQADSEVYHKIAAGQLEGQIKECVNAFSDRVLDLLAQLDVCIDYPEEDIEQKTLAEVEKELEALIFDISGSISSRLAGQVITDGFKIALVGKPNVGKSSLLNAILGKDRVIVTDIPGTTRDVLDESFTYKGMLFTFVDTAGIRQSDDVVEKIGIEKSFEVMNEANLVVAIIDGSKELDQQDKELLEHVEKFEHLLVINKSDLERASEIKGISISAKNNINIDELLEKIYQIASESIGNVGLIINQRHITLAQKAVLNFQNALEAIKNNQDIECIEIDIRDGWHNLAEITGAVYDEQIIDRIFEKFCLGK